MSYPDLFKQESTNKQDKFVDGDVDYVDENGDGNKSRSSSNQSTSPAAGAVLALATTTLIITFQSLLTH